MISNVFLRILCIFLLIGGIVAVGILKAANKNQPPDTSHLHSTSSIHPNFASPSNPSSIERATSGTNAVTLPGGYLQQPRDTSPPVPSIPRIRSDNPPLTDTHNETTDEPNEERTLEVVAKHWTPKRIGALYSETTTDGLILVNACVEESRQSPHTTTMQTLEADGSYDATAQRYVRAQHVIEPQTDGLVIVATLVGNQLFAEISACVSSWP